MNQTLSIGIIGDYDKSKPSHLATNQAIRHAAESKSVTANVTWLPTPSFLVNAERERLAAYDGIWISPGSPYRSVPGALKGIKTAREMNIPLIGTCGGYQHALLEYMMNVIDEKEVGHPEYDPDISHPLFVLASCPVENRPEGAPRLWGNLRIKLATESLACRIYGCEEISEAFTCNFELNPEYREILESGGARICGTDEHDRTFLIEFPGHTFFIITGFQPQLSSEEGKPHPLVTGFLEAAITYRQEEKASQGINT
jgi:CTP synthase (UTP-ammonia lyase)